MTTTMTTPLNDNLVQQKRVHADDRLDALYMREMRCPYCNTKMPQGTSKCKNCALTKEQIYYAKLASPFKRHQNVLMSRIRPAELPLWKVGVGSIFGFLGIHCFISKRYLRGLIMLMLTISFIVMLCIFPPYVEDSVSEIRQMFEEKTYLFPGDLLGIFALGLWVWDLFAVWFGQFKYPVIPNIEE